MREHVKFGDQRVGEFYAVGVYGVRRAELLAVRVEYKKFSGVTKKDGAKVRYDDGAEAAVPMNQIRWTWAIHTEREERDKVSRQTAEKRRAADAESVAALHLALVARGVTLANWPDCYTPTDLRLTGGDCRAVLTLLSPISGRQAP